MKISSFGAAKTVTGSCHVITEENIKVMVDCGLFQGRGVDNKNTELGFNPEEIDFVILTHAHLDHCGRLPMLLKNGFKGKIYSTMPTFQLARLILLDTAKIMLEDYNHALKRHLRNNKQSNKKLQAPLFNESEVFETLDRFEPILQYDKPLSIEIKEKTAVSIKMGDAGHILGSGFLKITIKYKSVIFSGDLGNKGKPILNDFSYPDGDADAVYIETTYGDRLHKSFELSKTELLQIVKDTIERGGNILIPSFAMERTQDLLYILKEFYVKGELPKCRIFLDSPLAISITDIFLRNLDYFKKDLHEQFKNEDPFEIPYLKKARDVEESKAINQFSEGSIIIAGSGMLTGGRMIHHLKYNLWREENSMVFIGYQAKGTLGRDIVDGDKDVRVFGETINIGAHIYTLGGFSSHADRDELLDWLNPLIKKGLKKIFLIHGEEDKMDAFKGVLESAGVHAYEPSFGEEIEI